MYSNYHTCQVTSFRRVTPGNRACHSHFPEHPSGHGFHYDDPELVLEIFLYSENTGILLIERTTIQMVNYNQQQYTFEVSGSFTIKFTPFVESLSCFYNKKVKSFLQNVYCQYWKEEVLI